MSTIRHFLFNHSQRENANTLPVESYYDTNYEYTSNDNNAPPPTSNSIFDKIRRTSVDGLLNRNTFSAYGIYFDCVVKTSDKNSGPVPYGVVMVKNKPEFEFIIPNIDATINKPVDYNQYIDAEFDKIINNYDALNVYITRYFNKISKNSAQAEELKTTRFNNVEKFNYNKKNGIQPNPSPDVIDYLSHSQVKANDTNNYNDTLKFRIKGQKQAFVENPELHAPLFYDLMFKQVIEEINSCDSKPEYKSELCKFLSKYQHTDSGGARRRKKSSNKKSSNKKSGHKKSQNKKPRITRRHKRTRASHKK